MGPAHRAFAASCAGLLLATALALPALAQEDAKPHKRPQPLPQPASADASADNTAGPAGASGSTGAQPAAPGASPALRPPTVTPPVLRSAVQSRWSRPPTIAHSTAGQCRAQCAVARSSCAEGALGGADTSGCDPGWTECLSACEGLGYSRGP